MLGREGPAADRPGLRRPAAATSAVPLPSSAASAAEPGTAGTPVRDERAPVPDHLPGQLQLGRGEQVVQREAVVEARPQVGQLHGVPGAPLVPGWSLLRPGACRSSNW